MSWKAVRYKDKLLYYEKVPYDKCPHCSEYEFTMERRVDQSPGLIFGRDNELKYKLVDKCNNCKLKQNKRVVSRDELESEEISNKVL